MLASIAPYLRCPACESTPLLHIDEAMQCECCRALYPLRGGVLDLTEGESRLIITPFQRLMQSPAVASIYEGLWRRIGYFLASSRSFDAEISTVLDMSRKGDTRLVLDLACGTGVFTRPLARQSSGIVVGLDLSWAMLRQAQRRLKKTGLRNILFLRGSASHIPFVDGTFSYVNCCGALHLFDRPREALAEIDRVLARGGHLAVQTVIRPIRSAGFTYPLERFIRFGFFNAGDLDDMLREHRFEIVAQEKHRLSCTFLGRHIS